MSTAAIPAVETPPSSSSGERPGQALVPSTQSMDAGAADHIDNQRVTRLPVELEVAIPLRDFRVRNLLTLDPGTIVESQWTNGEDVPLGSRDVQLAWSEFEVVDTHLAVRLTRLV